MRNEVCTDIAVPTELFSILDNGNAEILVVCPVCRKAHFIEAALDCCTFPGDKNIYGEPLGQAPMGIVCDECHAYAARVIPEKMLDDLARSGHIEAYEQVVRSVAEPGRILPPGPLTTPEEIWAWLTETKDCLVDIGTGILCYEMVAGFGIACGGAA